MMIFKLDIKTLCLSLQLSTVYMTTKFTRLFERKMRWENVNADDMWSSSKRKAIKTISLSFHFRAVKCVIVVKRKKGSKHGGHSNSYALQRQ